MEKTFSVSKSLIVSDPLPDRPGYTWTLASRFGQMLSRAEEQFGPRDPAYTILGFEFGEEAPKIWYPGNCKHIVVRLDTQCSQNPVRACYQLAHECIHVLSPTGSPTASVLEEGLAVLFQEQYVADILACHYATDVAAYRQAANYASQLLDYDPNVILKLRETTPVISEFTSTLIQQCCPGLPAQLTEALTRPFANASP